MKVKTYSKRFLRTIFAMFFFLILSPNAYSEISVESYCELNIASAQQELDYLDELNTLTQQYCDDPNFLQEYCYDPNSFLEQKLILQEHFDSNQAALFEAFNTTAEEYDTFLDTNATAVEEYLNNEPNIKQAIDNLSGQIDKILKELEVPNYCLLAVANAKQELVNLNELIVLAQDYSDEPNTFLEQERIKRKEFDDGKQTLFESFDTTTHEYITFMGENPKAVEKYLAGYPHIKQAIDDFSNQVNTLLEEYEALRESIVIISEPPR